MTRACNIAVCLGVGAGGLVLSMLLAGSIVWTGQQFGVLPEWRGFSAIPAIIGEMLGGLSSEEVGLVCILNAAMLLGVYWIQRRRLGIVPSYKRRAKVALILAAIGLALLVLFAGMSHLGASIWLMSPIAYLVIAFISISVYITATMAADFLLWPQLRRLMRPR